MKTKKLMARMIRALERNNDRLHEMRILEIEGKARAADNEERAADMRSRSIMAMVPALMTYLTNRPSCSVGFPQEDLDDIARKASDRDKGPTLPVEIANTFFDLNLMLTDSQREAVYASLTPPQQSLLRRLFEMVNAAPVEQTAH